MSNHSLPSKPTIFSLPSKPIASRPLIPVKSSFALPAKPVAALDTLPPRRRPSPSPDRSPTRVDTYRPPPSPGSRRRSNSRERGRRYRSPVRDTYIPHRSPSLSPLPNYKYRSPAKRRYTPSPRRRERSYSHSPQRRTPDRPIKRDRSIGDTRESHELDLRPFTSSQSSQFIPAKRPLSPSVSSEAPTKAIPTGPRGSSIPTGPKSVRPNQPSPIHDTSTSEDMPGPSRYRGNASRRGGTPNTTKSTKELPSPLHDHAQITHQYGKSVQLKAQWLDNPKAPLANHLGNGHGGADLGSEYRVEEGMIGNKKIFRVTVTGDKRTGITGVGDHTNRKEAEKLAALSAVLQLTSAGILDQGKTGGPSASNGVTPAAATSNHVPPDTAKLSDGSQISYERARQFMEYYCQRYKFGKPDIEFSQTSQTTHGKSRKGKTSATMTWDAVITVGNRRIGMGQASSKKGAQVKSYLDVTQYLESCDPGLWKDFSEFSKKDKSANLGMAPHLVFQMSDRLNEDIQGLCGDIRNSRLWEHAPPSSSATAEHHPIASWGSRGSRPLSEKELQNKSLELQDRLARYQSDPKLDAMRNQRQALPVTSRATEILTQIEVNDVTIVMAATGSGKTTQVPQLLFDDYINRGQGAKCNIVCTQPRRLAAMSVAERIADERGQPLGKEVGYQVRFDVKLPQPNGSITFCTTGIFLKRMQSALGATADPSAVARMDEVTHIVVDEVHERDIDTDLLLVVLKRLLTDRKARNKPIKIILMSATIDPTLFKTYFADVRGRPAPVAEIPGRTFPVERLYLDEIVPQLQGLPHNKGGWVFNEKNVSEYLNSELSRDPANFGPGSGMALEIPYPLVALTISDVMKRSDDGHVLVFLPGWDEIKKVADILMDTRGKPLMGTNFNDSSKFSIHYLHSTIPAAEQKEVFRPPPKGVRRIILATNIAETSITIPDVVYVIDTARVKEKRYDPERHMSSLVSAWVGSSNLSQRAGRAGRHREGEYYGLLSKKRFEALDPHQLVEMKRSDLSNVALNLGEVEEVLAATIEPPEPSRIVAAMEVLRMLGALDANLNLTALGRVLLQLPVEAAIGKLCLYGSFFRCLDSALTLAAVLTNRDPFLAPIALKAEADRIKDSWCPPAFRSDPLAIVSAYNQWSAMDDRGDYRTANQFCSDNFLSKPTMLQIKQVKGSLLQSLDQAGVIAVSAGGAINKIGRRLTVPKELDEHGNSLPLLAALIAMASAPNFALRTSDKTCRTSQDKRLYAFGEKSRNVPLGGKDTGGITQLRSVTRLDPMTYMLFGAYELVVTQRGLECDRWLPVIGNLHALDDVQRLKVLLDGCMLRVFEGVGRSLTEGRDQRWRQSRNSIQKGSSRITSTEEEIYENESDDEDDTAEKDKKRIIKPLSVDEIKELELLTTDVVRVLDAYSAEREGGSTAPTRPVTPMPSVSNVRGGYAKNGHNGARG
ncbi:uncharacterized protein I206_100127 [Kwoniella pini CBS 10737]|uniref:Nuclear DNA helicase II n=1 Tax=Kwoniella pini CBS 10737 TaxID=1296096 RepID=A0AAJ8MJY5_9TREE